MIAERIKNKRLEFHMTQEELASRLGLQKSVIAKYENGRISNIKRSTIQKMAEIFECSPVWLMGLDATPETSEEAIKSAKEDAQLVAKYRALSPEDRKTIDDMLNYLYEKAQKQK